MKLHTTILKVAAISLIAVACLAGVQAGMESGVTAGFSTGLAILGLAAIPFVPTAQTICFGFDASKKAELLKEYKARASVLQPSTAARVMGVLAEFEESLKPENADEAATAHKELLEKSLAGDAEAKAELAKLRIITVDNFVLATTNPAAFFDTVTLADNEVPYIENTSRSQEITISYLGQDGRARKTQPIKYQAQAQVDLHNLSTEEYEYVLRDIYKGEVKSSQLANVDMARDFGFQISKLMWPFIKAAIGPFVTTGARAGRTFVPHSIVNTKNLPTTNLLTPTGNTTTTLWRKVCMDVVLKYCAAWGDVLGAGQMKPQAVYIPSSEVMGYLDEVTLTSQPNTKVEEIFETGFVLTYGGARWVFIADATLDPDEGRAYVKFNKAVGIYFTKPGMDQTFEDETIGMQKQNKGSVSMSKVVGWGLPIQYRVNVAAVQYHTAR